MQKTLNKLGLTYPEDKIYLSILRLHRTHIVQLSQETGIHRPTIYRVLPLLIEKGLISKIRIGRRTFYIAEDPKNLEALAEEITDEVKKTIPELSRIYTSSQKRPVIRFFEQKQGIRHVYDDMIRSSNKGDATYRYESPRDYKMLKEYYSQSYWKRGSDKAGEIEKYVITNEQTHVRRSPRINRHSKSIPAVYDNFDYNITELIYKNKVAFIDFDTETATVIENQRFADFQRKLFKLLFKKL